MAVGSSKVVGWDEGRRKKLKQKALVKRLWWFFKKISKFFDMSLIKRGESMSSLLKSDWVFRIVSLNRLWR